MLALKLAGLLPPDKFRAELVAELRGRGIVGAACSGGADSVCLLLLLWAHMPELRERLLVLHFDHRIRGEQSAGDADFVRALAVGLGLCCESGSWAASTPDASEDAAREARMDFLHSHASVICFGHNRDDVAETMLLRIG
ncbi:MAG: ATP-binding protein, partial [Opitutales bacterium]